MLESTGRRGFKRRAREFARFQSAYRVRAASVLKTHGGILMHTVFEHPYRPVSLETSITKGFPLNSMAEQLIEEATGASTGRAALTLARGDDLTVVLTAMTAGTVLHEHRAPSSATVVALKGNIVFSSSTENVRLEQGEAVVFTADVLHAVEANEDSVFLIVIGGKNP